MQCLELSYEYYKAYGEEMLKNQFQNLLPYLAVGLIGSGSECLSFDDELSKDHDFFPGFCIFLPDENIVDRKQAFLLQRAYDKLPKEFMGFKKSLSSPAGGNRQGPIRICDFLESKTGTKDGNLDFSKWLSLPEQYLLEITNGKIFQDNYGLLSEIRKKLFYLPEDVRLKKLSSALFAMGQSGQYNYERCFKRNDKGAAGLSLFEFVKNALHTGFLLNFSYMPYYKWQFKALSNIEGMEDLKNQLEKLLIHEEGAISQLSKLSSIEEIASFFIGALQLQGLSDASCNDLQKHAASVNDHIKDNYLRNLRY